jgi:DNA mismatch repair protein MutS
MIIDDYLEYAKTYKDKYGDKCIILMQVGSFYEMYSIKDDTSEDIYAIADICNIQISRKNKTIPEVSISNPLMAGFPLYTLHKFTTILLNNNYTIVLIEQVSEPPNPERKITEILSPGMNINVAGRCNNYMMVIYYEFIADIPVVGISGIDLSTGNSFVYEAGANKQDIEFVNDEVFRIITTYNPCELIILSDKKYDDDKKHFLTKHLNLNNILTHAKWNSYEHITSMCKLTYQNTILEKAFAKKKCMVSIIETLNLEKYVFGRIALCCLLQFAYEHNVDIIKNLNIPEIINDNTYMAIEYNSAVQLNILGLYQNDRPLIDILNRCMTAFGARIFKERLLKPIINPIVLNKRYDEIDYLLQNNRFQKVSKLLCGILDLERIKRKMFLNKFHPHDWNGLNTSLENAVKILTDYYKNYDTAEYIKMIEDYKSILDFNEISKYNLNDIKGNIFLKGTYTEIDEYVEELNDAYRKITDISNKINQIDASGDTTSCKIDYNEKDGYYLMMTRRRFDTAKAKDHDFMKEFQTKPIGASNNIKLVNEDIIIASNIIEDKQRLISKNVLLYYQLFIKDFIEKYNKTFDDIIKIIIDIDIACCNAKNAFEYRYYRPVIKQESTETVQEPGSYINAENIRHPIIERIDDTVSYIGNDISLSSSSSYNGMLLYGINSAGKSSLMKSIGLNIIMAQSGMFVAASSMTYYPYKHIFTRISGMDNIYKGMSSFIVEMTELRNILQRCDKYSLVIGDEICNGTEAISALAIVAAGIDTLVKKQSSFIFATHLHDLTDLDIVKMHIDKYIQVNHIHITIDDKNRIVYERKIKSGKGSPTYGVEVCKTLDMPLDFMKIAEGVRKQIQGYSTLMVNPIKSRYNNDIYMSICSICKSAPAIDTHHINYQCDSDTQGFFKEFHKDSKHNLVALCKDCHKKEHFGLLDIKRYVKTSEGIDIDYDEVSSLTSNNPINHNISLSDLSEDIHDKLRQYIKRGKCNWYIRRAKTNAFKICIDEKIIIDRINKILYTNLYEISDEFHNKLYDPSY